ncbi:queuosine biosynthesis QueC ATPase [Candidatus Termititenax persephonae]|uniref:7-cyano-7-deazaguanine synthase n=1 Tax=Candidatus Termititenax persephonae TaxID=2218525 RepID=A0A388TGT0_9BACT|nr:queuosine biosynthesis QueC ATPase [Candidatus Termititenax persephonae]
MKKLNKAKALVCLSGGQDSATCLMWAAQEYGADKTYAVSFNYGQKHAVELACAQKIAEILNVAGHCVLDIPALKQIGNSALLADDADLNAVRDGLPASFVPGRNIIFLSQAAALAYKLDCGILIVGVGETDYSGYPDCRESTIKSLETALNHGMETNLEISAPLMHKDKAETWAMAYQCGGQDGVELIREQTHTCYHGDHETKQDWGYGCGQCPACQLRRHGYETFLARTPELQPRP